MENLEKSVGVIGGLGPMATVYFLEYVINLTDAQKDQEHINMVITNHATTKDRTEYIVGKSKDSPAKTLIEDAKKLEASGVDFIVITCNTAHYFYDEIQKSINIPIVNILEETVDYVKSNNFKKVGILATDGTINSKIYQNVCEKENVEYLILDSRNQNIIMDIIYNEIKCGKNANMDKFNSIIDYTKKNGCDCVILGCTELSILKNDNNLIGKFYIDSLDILARKTIEKCGKKIK